MFFSEETDVNYIRPNFFVTITKLISRHFGKNLKRIGRVSTKSRCNIKLFHCNGFFVLFEERLSLMKYMATFVLCLFRALYQGTDKVLDFTNNLYVEKTKAVRVHRLSMYSSSKRYACIYGNLCLILGGQRVSGQNVLTFLFFFA